LTVACEKAKRVRRRKKEKKRESEGTSE